MWIQTHLRIARLSLKKMDEIFTTDKKMGKVNRVMFCLGSMAPDMSPIQFKHPHMYEDSSDYIFSNMDKLQNKKKIGLLSSYELGKSIHYLCDFCCYAHRVERNETLMEHMRYEKYLDKYIRENFDDLKEKTKCDNMENKDSREINLYIYSLISDDEIRVPSYRKDITKSVKVITALCQSIPT